MALSQILTCFSLCFFVGWLFFQRYITSGSLRIGLSLCHAVIMLSMLPNIHACIRIRAGRYHVIATNRSSDRMHNLDLACTEQQHCCEETKRQEFIYWQHDEVSISMIMTTTFMLWNSNMWTFDMGRMLSAVSCGATCLVWLLSKSKTVTASAPDLALGAQRTQGLMGIQFFVCFGWMVAHVLANNENMRFYTLIWSIHSPRTPSPSCVMRTLTRISPT